MNLIIVLVISAVVFFISLSAYVFLHYMGLRKASSSSERELNKLRQEHALLKNSVEVLRSLSSQYFVTLNENGFSDLCSIESALAETIDCCDKFIANRDLDSMEQILYYLYIKRGNSAPPSCIWAILGEQSSHLIDWSDRAKEMLIHLIECINQSSNDLKEIGGAARRKRKSTIIMLNEARTALGAI